MNKKETAEIKKNFSDKSGFFIMERVLTAFVDAEKNVRCQNVSSCLTMPVEEHDVYDETLKKVLNTNVGKNFSEYEFPNEAYEEDQPQHILYSLLKSELKDEIVCENFLNHIANNIAYTGPFAVITAYCVYTIRKKDKNDEFAEGEDEPDAAIFSKDDLAIEGEGSLAVRGNYDMGIHGKDSLFLNANVTVDAVGDGVKGKDAVYLADCELTVTAGGDGIQSNNDAEGGDIFIQSGQITVEAQRDGIKAEHSVEITGGAISVTAQEDGLKANNTIGGGQILIEDGEVTIDAQQDGIQSDGDLTITGGTIGISTLGGAANAPEHQGDFFRGPPGWFNDTTAEDETASAKGIKCVYDMAISGGRILIDAYDDALHSDGTVTISGDAEIMIASGDDGMHANDHLTIESGTVNITQSYEGIEAVFIDILGGDIYMKTSDDGMNANGEEMFGPFGSPNATDSLEDAICYLHIAGGHLIVNAAGDGLDSNGYLFVEGGETYVSGPSNSMNGSLDYGSTAQINGGTLMAFGASGMDETFGYSSTQPAIKCTFNTSFTGDSPLALTDSQGNTLVEFQIDEPDKKYNSVVVSCPELTVGETYTLTCGEETVEIELTDLITTVRQTAAGSPETYAYSRGFGPGGGPPPGGPGW